MIELEHDPLETAGLIRANFPPGEIFHRNGARIFRNFFYAPSVNTRDLTRTTFA